MAVNNAKAVLEAIFGHQSAFVRTPKYGVDRKEDRPARLPAQTQRVPGY